MISEKPPLDVGLDINRSIVHLLHRAGQCTGETFAARLAHLDLTPRQFAVMNAIAGLDGANQVGITQETGIDRSTMVDVVRRLMRRGLLQRRRNRSDGRSYVVRLTPEGRDLLTAALPFAAQVDADILASLPRETRELLVDSLGALVRDLTADAGK